MTPLSRGALSYDADSALRPYAHRSRPPIVEGAAGRPPIDATTPNTSSRRGALPAFVRAGVMLAVGGLVGIAPLIPPQPVPADAAATEFSAARAIEHVRQIAQEPHPIGSAANAEVRSYLVGELERLGLDTRLQSTTVQDYFGSPNATVDVVNVMARIPGRSTTGAIVLMGHYDSDPNTPGANDNAAAVAAVLEAARAIISGDPLRNDVILLLTDGEEPAPRFGATAFVDRHRWAADVAVVINFEAVGGHGASQLTEVSEPNRWLIEALAGSGSHPAASSFLTTLVDAIGGVDTDLAPFLERGYAGMLFTYTHGSPIYHTAADNPDAVGLRSVQHHGEHALSLARTFGEQDLGVVQPGGSLEFFTIGPWLVRYPTTWAVPAAILAALILGWALARRRNAGTALGSDLRSAALGAAGLVGAAILTALLWVAITSVRSTPGIVESYVYLAVLAGLAFAGMSAIRRVVVRNGGAVRWTVAIAVLWTAFALTSSIVLPGMGYLFTWPAMAIGVPVLAATLRTAETEPMTRALVAVPALVLCIPAIDVLYQFAQPRPGNPDSEVTAVAGAAVLLLALVMESVRVALPDGR